MLDTCGVYGSLWAMMVVVTQGVTRNASVLEMDIRFDTSRLREECNDFRRLQRRYGQGAAKLVRRRLDDLRAAETLAVMRPVPGDCHELRGDRKDTLAMKVGGGKRLIFEPAHRPIPRNPDGGLDWAGVTAVTVLGVEDYHD